MDNLYEHCQKAPLDMNYECVSVKQESNEYLYLSLRVIGYENDDISLQSQNCRYRDIQISSQEYAPFRLLKHIVNFTIFSYWFIRCDQFFHFKDCISDNIILCFVTISLVCCYKRTSALSLSSSALFITLHLRVLENGHFALARYTLHQRVVPNIFD